MNDLRARIEAILDKPRQYTSFNFTVNGDKWVFHDDDEFVTRNAVVKLLVEIRKDIRAALGEMPMKEAPPGPYRVELQTTLPDTKWSAADPMRDALVDVIAEAVFNAPASNKTLINHLADTMLADGWRRA